MTEWQQRVVAELEELRGRLDRLDAFMVAPSFPHIDPAEQARMKIQRNLMAALAIVLQQRIDHFGDHQ